MPRAKKGAIKEAIAEEQARVDSAANMIPGAEFRAAEVEVKTVIKPVQNAIAILRYLTEVQEPRKVTQVSRELGLNPSTCFNIMRTLAGEQILSFDPDQKTYTIGIGIMQIAAGAISEDSRLAAARPLVQQYAERYSCTVCIWRRLTANRNILVASVYAGNAVRIHMEVGLKLPVLLGSTGRVMLPHLGLSKTELRTEFKKLRWFRPPSFDEFLKGASEAEERGWAVDDGDFSPGVLAISTPVFSPSGTIFYSLTAISFRDQHREHGITPLGEDLSALARELRTILY